MSKYLEINIRKFSMTIALPSLSKVRRWASKRTSFWPRFKRGTSLILVAFLFLFSSFVSIVQPLIKTKVYALGRAGSILSPIDQAMASKLKLDPQSNTFTFNKDFKPNSTSILGLSNSQVTANLSPDASQGVTINSPSMGVSFTMTPQFKVAEGQKNGNRVVYPLMGGGGNGWLVYTMHGVGIKEDILLTSSSKDKISYDYKLGLGDKLAARLNSDGSIGIYGNSLFSSNISTSSDKDAQLLQKAREHAAKDKLIFTIPAPIIYSDKDKIAQHASAKYQLSGDTLSLNVTGLKDTKYPLSIDPSIYVSTAQQFMNGNNETNIEFDVADSLIQKGKTTGARFDSWTATKNLNNNIWQQGAATAGGFIYTVGGNYPNGSSQTFSTQGADTFTVPAGISSVTVKMWGGGGGGGGGGRSGSATGGDGGGGGYVTGTFSVNAGDTLNVYVGGGGQGGQHNAGGSDAGGGGGGGGYSSVYNYTQSNKLLAIAAGGAGGGGARNTLAGGQGGGGGGTTGEDGTSVGNGGGGGGATSSTGGSAGNGGNNDGQAGSSLTGGNGADGRSSNGADGNGVSGGAASGGNGGQPNVNTTRAGGGGGGAGYYGGGGGGATSSTNSAAGGGGGGGSSYTDSGASGVTNSGGSGSTPGNSGDSARSGAGSGGGGAPTLGTGSAGANGLVIISAGSGSTNTKDVSWAQFSPLDGTIVNADPGSGTCSGWCTSSLYALPAPRSNLSLVAYNGFLYAIGGEDSGCTSASGMGDGGVCDTVYIAKLGANGEPQLWHPTSSNKSSWVYWYRDTDLTSPRSLTGAVAYENRMYLIGGKTSSSGTASTVSSVQIANISPTGTLQTWSTSSSSLPSNLYGHGIQIYNGYVYVVGGASSIGGTPSNNTYYSHIASDGSMSSWTQTASMATGRITNGGNFTTVWGGYIYIVGGCSAINGSGYCTSIASTTELASINADGSLDAWNTNQGVTNARMGHNVTAWGNYIYEIGGCSAQNTTTGACTTPLNDIQYGTINQDGDASTVSQSVASGTAPCTGSNPYNCNLPNAGSGAGQGGQMLSATAVINGYLYVIGGCSNYQCNATSTNTSYAAIASDGSLTDPNNCVADGNTLVGAWCVDSTNTISGGVAAAGTTVFNGRIYIVGGLTGGGNKNTILYNNINTDGSLAGGWTSQSLTGAGGANVSYNYTYSRANPSSAGTNPGNLYMFGGCATSSSAGCTAYNGAVYKCNIQTSGAVAGCSTSGQLQIGIVPGDTASGLGMASGTVYANYIYLIGGVTPNQQDLKTIRYAKFDNSNNVVAASGSSWTQSPITTQVGRRRGAAFGYNGYIYVVGGYDGTDGGGILADIEFGKVNVSDGSLVDQQGNGMFNVSSVTIGQRWGLSVPVSNSYAYVIGGCNSGNSPNCNSGGLEPMVQTFQLYNNDSGSPASYGNSANNFSTDRMGAGAVVNNGYIYIAGGCTSPTDCTNATNSVQYAPLDANGNVGTWAAAANLPADRTWGQLVTAGGSLYYVGGQSDTASDERAEVYYATPNGSGNITSWATASNGLPSARTQASAAVWNNRIYVTGGNDTSGNPQSTVYVSPQLNYGGNISSSWSTTTSFNVARSGLTAISYANNLYVLGGYDGSNYLSDVQFAQINSNGTLGSWTYTTSLPSPIRQGSGFAVNGYMYLVGGRTNDNTCAPSTLVAPISANTTIASGNNPTGIGEWYQTNAQYSGGRYGPAVAYDSGKTYVLGGACSASNAPSVTSVTTTNTGAGFASDSTNHNVNMPSTTSAGDLLLMFFSYDNDGNPTVTDPDGAGGWTQLTTGSSATNGVTGSVWAKVATGSDGATVNFVTSNAQSAVAKVYRIPASSWYGSLTNGITVSNGTGSTSATRTMPSLAPSWGTTSNLWLAYVAGSTYTGVNSYPTNYTSGTTDNGNTGTNGASASVSQRALLASSETPGNYTMSSSQTGIGFTVAVRPSLGYTGTNSSQQTTLLSQPQVAHYSIMFDTGSDVYPQKWLLNGLDNSTGAAWQMSYQSMTNPTTLCTSPAMTYWGQNTDFGDVTLGQPETYTPKNSSGANTNCARFYYLSIGIDSSRTYGYPEDVSRGPTLTDLTLEFTADPSKRLMHGRTFTGGIQQPDATPF